MSRTEERDLAEWDAEIEAEFQRAVATGRTKAKAKSERKQAAAFVKAPIWWLRMAAKHARSPATLVLVELLYRSWKAKSSTFALPSGRLREWGVSREIKRRVLRDLQRGGVILVERSDRKSPVITLVGL